MKKSIPGLLTLALFFSACSKDDKGDEPGGAFVLSRLSGGTDTLSFAYNADGTISKIHEHGLEGGILRYHDSMGIVWEGGKLKKIQSFEDNQPIDEMVLTYNGDKIIKAQYFAGTEAYEYDTLIYNASNEVIEVQRKYNDGYYPYYTKLTWANGNVTKAEVWASNGDGSGRFFLGKTTNYEYNDKPGISSLTKGNVITWMSTGDIEFHQLSTNAATKSTTVDPDGEPMYSTVYTYGFEGSQMSTYSEQLTEGGQTRTTAFKLEYIRQ